MPSQCRSRAALKSSLSTRRPRRTNCPARCPILWTFPARWRRAQSFAAGVTSICRSLSRRIPATRIFRRSASRSSASLHGARQFRPKIVFGSKTRHSREGFLRASRRRPPRGAAPLRPQGAVHRDGSKKQGQVSFDPLHSLCAAAVLTRKGASRRLRRFHPCRLRASSAVGRYGARKKQGHHPKNKSRLRRALSKTEKRKE